MEILGQLGEMFLQAVPTVIIVFFFYLFLRGSFFKPLEKVMAERAARIEGAKHAGEDAVETAERKEREYQEQLMGARTKIYAMQEARRGRALEERAALVRETRERAMGEVQRAKGRIAAEERAARQVLEKESGALAHDIVRAILMPGPRGSAR